MDRYLELKSFVLTAELCSFSKAALHEGVTPIIMARRLSTLEKRLGVTLMHRSTRGLTLTHLGEEYWQQCQSAVKQLENVEEAMMTGRNRISGHLSVSAPAGFGRQHVAPHAKSFLEKYPQVRLSFNLTDKVLDLVKDGFDLAVRIGGELDPNYVRVKLYNNHRVVCGTPAYFAKHGVPEKIEDLVKHNCIIFNPQGGQVRGWSFRHRGKDVSMRVNGTLECNEGEMIYQWAKQGLGLAWRSTWEVQADLEAGLLQTVLDKYAIPDYDILAVYQMQPHLPLKIKCFIQHLKEIYQAPNYWQARKIPATVGAKARKH